MTWVLTICTAGFVACGMLREANYPDEASCYKAMNEIYRLQGKDAFKYVTCAPRSKP